MKTRDPPRVPAGPAFVGSGLQATLGAMEQEGRVRTFGNLGFSDEIVVHDGERTRTVVKATLIRRPDGTPHSVQLSIDRFDRASKRDPWPTTPTRHIPLDGPAFDALFAHMAAWKEILPHGRSTRYVTLLVGDERLDTRGVLELLAGFRRNPRAFLPVLRLLSEDDAEALQAASNLARMRRSRDELVALIDRDPPERELQTWFEEHPWIFGSEYVAREDRRRFGIDTEGDFVMRSADDFIDLFELKKASAPVLRWDASHSAWSPTRDLAEAIGQALKYAESLDDHKMILRDRFDLPVVYPRVRVVIGRSVDWNEAQRRALRRLNAHLNGIELLTFDQVLARADVMIGHLAASLDPEPLPPAQLNAAHEDLPF